MNILKILGGIALVAGTTIGGGMLGLPIATGAAGFFPTAFLFIVCWSLMLLTSFYFLEVNLSLKGDVNIISMARHTIGPWAQGITWVVYLLLLYALTAAYIAASGPLLAQAVATTFGIQIPHWFEPFPILLVFGTFVYTGTRSVDLINRLLIIGLAVVYFIVMFVIGERMDTSLLVHHDWGYLLLAGPFVFVSFGYHIIIPSLTTYFKKDAASIKLVLIIGSVIPLLVYLAWQAVVLGVIPLGGHLGILESYQMGLSVVPALEQVIPGFSLLVMLFSFFLIITSFLGVSLSLSDFLADGLGIKKTHIGRLTASLLTFIPPLAFSLLYPRGFILALEYGGIFVAILLGILPAAMVWWGRYKRKMSSPYKAPGGQFMIFLAIFFFLVMIVLTILEKIGTLSLALDF